MPCCRPRNEEPALGELLDDPIVALLMARDGVTRSEMEALMEGMPVRSKTDESQRAGCTCG